MGDQSPGLPVSAVLRRAPAATHHRIPHISLYFWPPHRYFFRCRVDRQHFSFHADINVKAFGSFRWCLHKKALPLLNGTTNIIWQTAVGKRNIFAAFNQDNFCCFIQPAQAGGSRCAPSNSTDYNVLLIVKASSFYLLRKPLLVVLSFKLALYKSVSSKDAAWL